MTPVHLYREASKHQRDGNIDKARMLYKQLISEFPHTEQAEHAEIELGNIEVTPKQITPKTEKITHLERIDDLEEREYFHKAEGKTMEPRHPKPNESDEGNKFSMAKLGTVFWVAAATVVVSIAMSNMKSKELALAGVVACIGFIVFVRPIFRSFLSRESLNRDIDTQEDERHVPDFIHTVIVYAPMIVSGILAKFVGDTMLSVTDSPERAIVLLPGLIITSWLAYTREISAWFIPFLISVAGIAYCLWVFYVGDWSNLPNAPYFFGF